MARPLRLEFAGALYHITARGNARQAIYRDDVDRQRFLATLAHAVDRYGWLVHAYCLMDNHYHLLIETPKPTLARGMRHLNGTYTQAVNRRHQRVGHLFQGRYTAIMSNASRICWSFVATSCSIPCGPERASDRSSGHGAAIGRPLDWPRYHPGSHARGCWRSSERTSGLPTRSIARSCVRARRSDPGRLCGARSIWDARSVADLTAEQRPVPEVPRMQWQGRRQGLAEILAPRKPVAKAVAHAYRDQGYRLREIAAYYGVHYATVSRWLRAAERGNGRAES